MHTIVTCTQAFRARRRYVHTNVTCTRALRASRRLVSHALLIPENVRAKGKKNGGNVMTLLSLALSIPPVLFSPNDFQSLLEARWRRSLTPLALLNSVSQSTSLQLLFPRPFLLISALSLSLSMALFLFDF